MMKKDKLKLLLFNLFWCITTFFISYLAIDIFLNVKFEINLLFSLLIYLIDVIITTNYNYLEERIKKLEDKN